MEDTRHSDTPKIALWIVLIAVIPVFLTLSKALPIQQIDLKIPYPQLLNQVGMWINMAELLFLTGGFVILFGLICLVVPRLRYILWAGVSLMFLSGLVYLLAVLLDSQREGIISAFQHAGFLFLLSLSLPFLVVILTKRINQMDKSKKRHAKWINEKSIIMRGSRLN